MAAFNFLPTTPAGTIIINRHTHTKHREEKKMARLPPELEALNHAFSGLGVDETSLISILGKSSHELRKSYRKGSPHFFTEDERCFERWDDRLVKLLKHEFLRFKNAVVLWAMHPWERDARLVNEALVALVKGTRQQHHNVIVEIACTRSSEELLGARKAYHSLFDHSMEEDIAASIRGSERKLLVALVSAYRYEGPKVKEDVAKSEAKILASAIKNAATKNPMEDEEVVRILTTRSKLHLRVMYNHYKEVSGKTVDEDLAAGDLKDTVECLCAPHTYFSKVLDEAMRKHADKKTPLARAIVQRADVDVMQKSKEECLTRVIASRADVDMKDIKEEFSKQCGASLSEKIGETTKGNYRDFLLALVSRGD